MFGNYAVFIHRLYFNGQVKKGGLDQIIEYILNKDGSIILTEFPLDYSQHQYICVSRVTKGSRELLIKLGPFFKKSIINWPLEVLIGILVSLKLNNSYVVISSDPLTTLPVAIMRRIRFFKYLYYHAVDFSLDRFHNRLLDSIYFLILLFGLRSADLVGIVTKRASDRLTPFRSGPFFYVPNSPDFSALSSYRINSANRDRFALVVTCAEVSDKFKISSILDLTLKLKRLHPKISLHVLGNFDVHHTYCDSLNSFINKHSMQEYVHFYGNVSKEENCKVIAFCGIGLAFYDDETFKHIKFGDSLKIREYCALGLPSVADPATSTALEMAAEKAGFCVTNFDEALDKISGILKDEKLYTSLSNNALIWAEKMDKAKILSNLFTELSKPHD